MLKKKTAILIHKLFFHNRVANCNSKDNNQKLYFCEFWSPFRFRLYTLYQKCDGRSMYLCECVWELCRRREAGLTCGAASVCSSWSGRSRSVCFGLLNFRSTSPKEEIKLWIKAGARMRECPPAKSHCCFPIHCTAFQKHPVLSTSFEHQREVKWECTHQAHQPIDSKSAG